MVSKKYDEVLKNLESNISNKKDLDYIKTQINELTIAYIDEINKENTKSHKRFGNIEKRLLALENKVDLLDDEDVEEEYGEKIKCPYCNHEFFVEYDITNQETNCPSCDNLIVLDWGEFEDDM